MIKTIVKRDGAVVPFDTEKIYDAIHAAALDATSADLSASQIEVVVETVIRELGGADSTSVEEVQDAVEKALMHVAPNTAKAYILYRQKRAELRSKAPDPKALSDYIHAAKYARYLSELSRRETFAETVARVEAMHIRRFPHLADITRQAFDAVRDQRVLPSMRSMQFGGAAVEANHNRLYNCSFSHIDRLEVFSQALYLLLCGCGVGYSVQFEHIEKLPTLATINPKAVRHHVIADTIEGWADALKALVYSYVDGTHVEFSYHLVRPVGSPLKTSGGRAPGHMKLKESLERIRGVLHAAQGRKLRPIECHRIICHSADAVLSGGVRRSACICLFSLNDAEMLNAKTGDWWSRDPWFANANNSVVLLRDSVTEESFKSVFQVLKGFGEPGFYFSNHVSHGTNPCVPAGTRILTREGYVPIESRVGLATVVWNGLQWSEVTPQVTGHNQPMVRVHLSDGTHLDCTDYHEWRVVAGKWTKDHEEHRVQARLLTPGMVLARYAMPVVEGGEELPHAYTQGFFSADGHICDKQNIAYLYGVKKELLDKLDAKSWTDTGNFDRIRAVLPTQLKSKSFVPVNASVSSKLEWLAGLLDGDGHVQHNPKSLNLVVSSVDSQFLLDTRLMLTTLGVQAKIAKAAPGGLRALPDGKGGKAEYQTREGFRLILNAEDTHQLVRLGLKTYRLDLSKAANKPQRDARRFVRVEAVERLPSADVVFCFTEPSNNTGTFEGIVTGQCCEIGLNPKLGAETGWAFCNLCEINAAKLTDLTDFLYAAYAATWIGTLQASYTSMPYLGPVSEELARREALLGISMTGMLDAPQVACNPEYQRIVAEKIVEWNKQFAELIGINPAARTTAIKPSGTASLELGGVASGHHPHHAHRYIRRVVADENEPVFQAFREKNPHMCVKRSYDDKWVIEFPILAPKNAIVKADVGAVEFLKMVQSTQVNWVIPGTADSTYSPGLTHNVSNTVVVKPEEWESVADYIWQNRDHFTGVSLLASTGDKDYAYAPLEAVVTPADEARWAQLVSKYEPLNYTQLVESEDGTALTAELACAGGVCEVAV